MGAALDIGLRELLHLDGGLYPRVDPGVLQRALEGEGVDYRRQHAHVVGGDTIDDAVLGDIAAADDVAAADDEADLGPQRPDLGNLRAERGELGEIDAAPVIAGEDFTADLSRILRKPGPLKGCLPTGRAGNARSAPP
jgi:hypothetical protein